MTDQIKALREMVEASSRIVAFTGAGCSTESGVIGRIFESGLDR